CLAHALIKENATAVKPAFNALMTGVQADLDDPRVSRSLLANLLGTLFVGLLAAALAFVLVLFARYANLYAHDVHHLFPVGARRWQTKMLALVLLLLPVFLQMGPVPLIFTVLLAVALYATSVEV